MFVPLISGGTICIPPLDNNLYVSEEIVSWIGESKINLIHCVPSLFRTINNTAISSENFKDLKYVLLSGEKIVPSELANWYNIFDSRIQLVNLYGTTETTMIRSYYKIKPSDIKKATIPIGSPIYDTELLISKNDFRPCNILVPGELYIISDYVTKGYLNAIELTHDKFLKINSGTQNERFFFKTGDKARMLPGGIIDLVGREDRQIKLRGIRIELDEIEYVLLQSEYIKNTIVVKHDEENGNESLIAFIIKNNKLQKDYDIKDAIQKYLEDHLPTYMIPSNIVEVCEFPLLSNGKINYKGLLDNLTAQTIIEPTNEIEAKLLSVWKEILGDKPISIEDSFSSIGGNSLNIMRLIGRIYKEYNVRISLAELFDNFTIKKQAVFIKKAKKDDLFVISKSGEKSAYNLSSAQERIYYNYELNKASTAFNLPMAWEIVGDFDKNKIENVLKLLIDRHESLRTEFKFENGKLHQVVRNTVDFGIEEINDQEKNVQNAISKFIKPFDLSRAPLIRCGIIKTEQGKRILIADIHHIVCDGMSQLILFTDFLKLYKGEGLKPLPIQYKDYADWENNFKTTDEYISHREFWLKNFEGDIPTLDLPTTNLGSKKGEDEGGNIMFEIDNTIINPILHILKEKEITTFSGLFSIFFIYLSQLTGQEDIVIGINTSGRIQEELENVVGMFVKTLPIRFQINSDLLFKDFVKNMHDYLIQAVSKQAYDLSTIVSELNNNRTIPIKNLIDAMFVFQNFEDKRVQTDDIIFSSYGFENATSKYPITLFASEGTNAIQFRLEYSSIYFTKSDVELIVAQFKLLVKTIAENLDAKILEYFDSKSSSSSLNEEAITFHF